MEIFVLTEDNISEVAEKSGRSEDDLLRGLSEARSHDETCYVAVENLKDFLKGMPKTNE